MLNQRGSASSHSPQASPRHEETHHAPPQAHAPNYKQSEADAAYERESGGSNQSHDEQPQARGIQKKDDSQIDISKVFYYGKKWI